MGHISYVLAAATPAVAVVAAATAADPREDLYRKEKKRHSDKFFCEAAT